MYLDYESTSDDETSSEENYNKIKESKKKIFLPKKQIEIQNIKPTSNIKLVVSA